MKWIGQHIWDFISRFRSDVYLEGTETGTIASGGNLGLDSNNKIVKAASGSGDLTITGDSGFDNCVVTSTGGTGLFAESGLSYISLSAFSCTAQSSTFSYAGVMSVDIINNANNNAAGVLNLKNARGAAGADNDYCGTINFFGSDEGGTIATEFAQIVAQVADATEGEEAGRLEFKVQEYNGTLTTGLKLDGDTNEDGEIDVTIGAGAASTAIIAGTLTMGSTATLNNSGVLQTAAQTNITSLGTLTNLQTDYINLNASTLTITDSTDTGDYFSVATTTHGATTITTVDDDNEEAHLNFVTDGDVTFKPDASGEIQFLDSSGDPLVKIIPNATDGFVSYNRVNLFGPKSVVGGYIYKSDSPHDAAGGELGIVAGDTTAGTTDNLAGGNLSLQGGRGKGTGVGGSILLKVAPAGASGSSLNSYVTPFTIDGASGKVTIAPSDITGDVFHLDADADTDNIVNIDAGVLDIDTTASITIDAADDITISAADNLVIRSTDDCEFGSTSADGLVTIGSAHTAGQAMHIDVNTDAGSILDIDAGILDIDVTGAYTLDLGGTYTVTPFNMILDVNTDLVGAENRTGLKVDFDRTVPGSGTAAHNDIGIDLDVNSASLGTSSLKGMDIDIVGATSGTSTAYGIDLAVNSADTNIGLEMTVQNGGTDIKCLSSANPDDYFSITTGLNGATTIRTVDDDAQTAHLTTNIDGHWYNFIGSGRVYWYAGTNQDDYVYMSVSDHGGYVLTTTDASGSAAADISFSANGQMFLDCTADRFQFGGDDSDAISIRRQAHSDGDSGALEIYAGDATSGQTDKAGGDLALYGGAQTGNAVPGNIRFHLSSRSLTSDGTLHSQNKVSEIFTDTLLGTAQKWYEAGGASGNDYFLLSCRTHGATTLQTVDGSGSYNADFTLDTDGHINFATYTNKDIFFKESLAERFHFHLDSTPTMEVTGNFDIDCSGTITLDSTGGTIAKTLLREFALPADGAGNYDGDIIKIGTNDGGGGGSTLTAGKIYYYHTNGSWVATDSGDPSTATGLLAVALGGDPDSDGMLLRGTVELSDNIVGTEALGSILYLDKATAGAVTTTAPTATGDIVRVVGYALTTGDAKKIWFNPDNTWVEHT